MGLSATKRRDNFRPPLPAPTESMDESGMDTEDAATTLTTRTDKTSYEIPEDGSPITIATHKVPLAGRDKSSPSSVNKSLHGRQKSQTSLLIEYFEGGKAGDAGKARPSVRVKVTPSSRKKGSAGAGGGAGGASDAVQITGIGRDRIPSYTRRISLTSGRTTDAGVMAVGPGVEGTEVSQYSSGSNGSGRPPVEIEFLPHGSDVSTQSRGLQYAPNESNVSSMPPDSLLEGNRFDTDEHSRDVERDEETPVPTGEFLKAPHGTRARSSSRDRITQKVMEKLGQTATKPRKSSRTRSEGADRYDHETVPYQRRRRSSKSRQCDEDSYSGAESSVLSSNRKSHHSGSDVSRASKISNNPRLLQMVEDTIKRTIMPEIDAIKAERRSDRSDRLLDTGLERRVSKSSSTPNIASKPKVVLNRDGDDPGTVLSRGDSERRTRRPSYSERPSSRRSSGKHSDYDDREGISRHKSRTSSGSRRRHEEELAAAGAGVLTAAALKQHDSRDELPRRRKRHSKSRSSRSRSAGLDELDDGNRLAEPIPPMPLGSHINDSDLTRDSILSAETDRPHPHSPADLHTPVREVSRGSLGGSTPSRTPATKGVGALQSSRSIESSHSPGGSPSTKGRVAALAAAGFGGAAAAYGAEKVYERHVDADGYGAPPVASPRRLHSPAQSVSSLKKNFEDESLVPQELRPRSAASRSSAGRLRDKQTSHASLPSGASSPITRLTRSRHSSRELRGDRSATPQNGRYDMDLAREGSATPGTPGRGESLDDWYERQHQLNDQYRDSMATTTNRDSYQTNPYPQDEQRFGQLSDASSDLSPGKLDAEHDVRGLGTNPQVTHTPHGAESAVASLMDPSNVSSNRLSDQSATSPTKGGSYRERMVSHLREMSGDTPPMYEGSTMSQTMPSQDRWAAIRGYARDISSASSSRDDISRGLTHSPRQSPVKSLSDHASSTDAPPHLGASGLPVADDPLPEIGHFEDDRSDVTTTPSVVKGPLGGDATGKETWPYTPEPEQRARDINDDRTGFSKTDGLLAAAAGGVAALTGMEALKQSSLRDDTAELRKFSPDDLRAERLMSREPAVSSSPAVFPDEGYVTDNHPRSAGALTPKAEKTPYSRKDVEEYERAMDAQDVHDDDDEKDDDDVFDVRAKHARRASGNSHGMASPLYDSATGRGKDHIQSKDIVALMDHLTVRDAQRNARDTEILVSLVRSAAEMRQSFDEMKRFIVEQDRIIMQNAERGAEQTVQRVLGGPRPQPSDSPRTPRRQVDDDVQTKRQGVLRRALRGLTGGKSANDLARVEGMLNQILDNVETLRGQQHGGGGAPPPDPPRPAPSRSTTTSDSLDSYEKLRNATTDSGYEPEGQAGSSSTPSYAGYYAPRSEKQQFHSGYDGRRGSENRVSTVMEGDEDDEDLEPHEAHVLNHQFENNEHMLTPTQESHARLSYRNTPPRGANYTLGPGDDLTPQSAEKRRLHKSMSPSGYGNPKVSRWSKTTSSSAVPESPTAQRALRPVSDTSGSTGSVERYEDERHTPRNDDRTRDSRYINHKETGTESRSLRSQGSKLTRTPSPLIPSEASAHSIDEYAYDRGVSPEQFDPEFDDPKYQAHRNSLLLQHPQPRPGQTGRHQNTLETQAHTFDEASGTNSDVSQRSASDFDPALWGSSGTAGLAKHRLSQLEPLSPVSMSSPRAYGGGRNSRTDDGPLVPRQPQQPQHQQKSPGDSKLRYEEDLDSDDDVDEMDWEPQFSNSGFSRGGAAGGSGSAGGYYSSPYGSGHLLEPIEEVRYSLETDSGHLSPEPTLEAAKAIDMRSPARKITGPRPMGTMRSPLQAQQPQQQPKLVDHFPASNGAGAAGVRRKPVGGSGGGGGEGSLRSESAASLGSETF